jgi:hypothetical protein
MANFLSPPATSVNLFIRTSGTSLTVQVLHLQDLNSYKSVGSPVLSGDMPYTYTRYSVPQITVGCIRWRFPEKTGEPICSSFR